MNYFIKILNSKNIHYFIIAYEMSLEKKKMI